MIESGTEMRFGRATRMSMFVVFILVASMFAAPSFLTNGDVKSPVMNAAAADIDRTFVIGTSDLAISTLSVFTYTMADEFMAIWPCHSTLLTWDESVNRIGDLATSWSVSPDGLTWTFEIAPNAYFVERIDPLSTAHPVTVDDVIYTYELVQNYTSNLHFYFPGEIDGVPNTIRDMTKVSDTKMILYLSGPYAPFVGALGSIPIVPKYYWEPLVDAAGGPGKVKNVLPIGSGAFYYDLPGLPTAGEVVMKRNPTWFQEQNRGWQLHVDTLRLRDMTDPGTAWLNLKSGDIDCFMGVTPGVYVNELPGTPNVIGFAQSTGFVYTYNLNQMTDEMRAELGGVYNTGTNSQLFQDPIIRQAMAMCIDKPTIISEMLLGLGTVADSLIADINPWYYDYGSTPGEVEIPFNPVAARELLWNNGWKYDIAGNTVPIDSDQCPLYGYVDEELVPLEFRFDTLTEAEWAIGATRIRDDTALAGVQLNLAIRTPSEMNSIWYSADYDTWLWDWMFTPLSDPSTDVLSVLTTMEIGSWSDVYWSDPEFDAIYNESLVAMDPYARGLLVDEMQRIAYEQLGCQCVAYRKELYGVSESTWAGFGDWNTDWVLMPDQGFPYLYTRMSPNGVDEPEKNLAPVITGLASTFDGTVGEDIPFTASATDGSPLTYQWYWGDGSKSGWLSSASTTHEYTADGIYTAYFAAKETPSDDNYITWGQTTVTVIDLSNTAPHDLTISWDPLSPDTGDMITFTGGAIDDNGDEMFFSWDFGDDYTALGQVVEHQYVTDGFYTVTMYVDDGHHGSTPRPVSTSDLIYVAANHPPSIIVSDYAAIEWRTVYEYTVTASDPDSDPLRFTWDWGDGDVDVTTVPTAEHEYMQKDTYTLTVYADDLSNLPNHNVSDTGWVEVIDSDNDPPDILAFSVSNASPYTGETITFSATAEDGDGDPMRFTFVFGDGTTAVEQGEETTPNVDVTFDVDKFYTTAGTKTARIYVYDGQINITITGLTINVVANTAPVIMPLPDLEGDVDEVLSFEAEAFDLEMDELTYTWDFGDGTPLAVGNPVTHAYAVADMYVYHVYVDDGHGHNVTAGATATIEGVPVETFTLELLVGWNMVTIPLVNHGLMASTLGLQFGDMVSRWDPATQTYDKNYIVGISGSASDFDLEASWGYWIATNTAQSIEVTGEAATETQTRTITVPGGGGWVQIGLASLATDLWASDIVDMCTADMLSMISKWNAASQTYSSYIVQFGIGDFQLNPGDGVWLAADMSGVLSYEP